MGSWAHESAKDVDAGKTNLYSNPTRWRGICYDVKDEIANILIPIISADNERDGKTVR